MPLGSQAALPTSQAYSSGETKVIINAGDSADDHDTDGKPVPGTSSASSTGSRSYVFTSDALTGYNGNASASATDPYGTLKGIVRGSGSGRANCSSVLRRPVAIRPVLIASVSSHLEKLP